MAYSLNTQRDARAAAATVSGIVARSTGSGPKLDGGAP
jgi:hypothetical protein